MDRHKPTNRPLTTAQIRAGIRYNEGNLVIYRDGDWAIHDNEFIGLYLAYKGRSLVFMNTKHLKGRLKTHVLYSEDKWYLIYRPAAMHSPKFGVLHPCGKGRSKPREMIRIDSVVDGADTLICPFCKESPSENFKLAWFTREDQDQSGLGNQTLSDKEFGEALAAELRKSRRHRGRVRQLEEALKKSWEKLVRVK